MKNTKLLKGLCRKNLLTAAELSIPIKDAYIKKSESSLVSSKILFKNDKLEESVALAYYSMYHSVTALFYRVGIKCENHTASIELLKEIFGIDNSQINFAKSERADKQYYVHKLKTTSFMMWCYLGFSILDHPENPNKPHTLMCGNTQGFLDTDFHITKEQVKEAINVAEEFNAFILDFISCLNTINIQNYQNKFDNILKQLK